MRDPEGKPNGAELEVAGRSTVLDRHNTRGEKTGPTLAGPIVGLLPALRTSE